MLLCKNCLKEIKEVGGYQESISCKNCGTKTKYFTAYHLGELASRIASRIAEDSFLSEIKKRIGEGVKVSIGNYSFLVTAARIEKIITVHSEKLRSAGNREVSFGEGLIMLESFIAKEKKRVEKALGKPMDKKVIADLFAWTYDAWLDKPAEITTHLIKEDELGKEFIIRPDIRKTDEEDDNNISLFLGADPKKETIISGKANVKYVKHAIWRMPGGGDLYIAKVKIIDVPLAIIQTRLNSGGVLHIFKIED